MLTIAVLAIVLTAPTGAIMVTLLGPLLLKKNMEEVEPQAEGNHIAASTNGLDIMGYLKGEK